MSKLKANGTLVIEDVNLRLLEKQRLGLQSIVEDDSILSTLNSSQWEALEGVIAMLNTWSDGQLKLKQNKGDVMRTIWKYELESETTLQIPIGAKVLCVQAQNNTPCLWVLVDPSNEKEVRTFKVFGTGRPIRVNVGKYIGTFQMLSGTLVYHVFEQ